MSNFIEIILKRKWVFAFFFILGFGSVLLGLRLKSRIFEAVATIQITEQKTDSGTSLLISQTKGVLSPLVMEKAVQNLGWIRAGDPASKLQEKILELQKRVSVLSEGNGIVHLRVRHASGPEAVKRVNAVAEAFQEMDQSETGAQAEQYQNYLQRQMQATLEKTSELEKRITDIEQKAPPPEVAAGLVRDIERATAARERLLKVFTPKHPEVVKFDKEIAHMQHDLDALPKPEGDLERLRAELAQAKEAYQNYSTQNQDALFKQAEEAGNVRILRRAGVFSPVKGPLPLWGVLQGLAAGLLLGGLVTLMIGNKQDTRYKK